jgi:hypothetical protein
MAALAVDNLLGLLVNGGRALTPVPEMGRV